MVRRDVSSEWSSWAGTHFLVRDWVGPELGITELFINLDHPTPQFRGCNDSNLSMTVYYQRLVKYSIVVRKFLPTYFFPHNYELHFW